MSDTRKERRAGRPERGERKEPSGTAAAPTYAVVASGENVVLVNTHSGQTWAMATDGGRPVWHPVAFEANATRAPRRSETKKAEAE